MVTQVQLDKLVSLNGANGHMTAIDADSLSVDLADELGEVLQTELVHVLVAEVHHSVRVRSIQHFSRQDWMAQKLTKDLGRREDVLSKFKERLLDRIKIIEAMSGILMEQVHQDLAHVVG